MLQLDTHVPVIQLEKNSHERKANYQYNLMPFGQKNVGATYKRMMNKIFKKETGETFEVYMDGMIIKPDKEELHDKHLFYVFQRVMQHKTRINPENCTFRSDPTNLWIFI